MTGGSLEESKEALAIAETDGLLTIFIDIPHIFLFLGYEHFIYVSQNGVFTNLMVHCLSQEGSFVRLVCTQQDARLIIVP